LVIRADLAAQIHERVGHFALESGHHGRRWLDLELLFHSPREVRPFVEELAAKVAPYQPELICGPLVEGAFVGLLVAESLGIDFAYAQRQPDPSSSDLFSVDYALPKALREGVKGRRVAVVNDVINAGSAVRGALADLAECGAHPVVLAALLALGDAPNNLAVQVGLPLEVLASDTNEIWAPGGCPLCANGAPLTPHPGF
jgi:orotate phosphoribosyltransferase